jgi:hypothetical protein
LSITGNGLDVAEDSLEDRAVVTEELASKLRMKTLAILPELKGRAESGRGVLSSERPTREEEQAADAEVDAGATLEELADGTRAVCFEEDTIESAWEAVVTAVRAFIADHVLGASEVRRNLTSDVFLTLEYSGLRSAKSASRPAGMRRSCPTSIALTDLPNTR